MKQFFIILLSSILLFPSIGNILVYAQFKLNQKEIIKTICVQRKLAVNTCNGRCELQKSIKKLESKEKEMQNNLKEKLELVYIQNVLETSSILTESIDLTQKLFSTFEKKPISIATTTFRPPAFL